MTTILAPFLLDIDPDKKELLELSYCVYARGTENTWSSVLIDNKNNQTKLGEIVSGGNLARMELLAILKSLEWLNNILNVKMKSYADITVFTNSIYCTNVLKEWIHLWVPSNFEGKPNSDLLIKIFPLLGLLEHLKISWVPSSFIL